MRPTTLIVPLGLFLILLVSGCPDAEVELSVKTGDAANQPPAPPAPLPQPEPRLAGELGSDFLEELLRDPPRLSPGLRTTLARELRDRFHTSGNLEEYAQELVRIAHTFKAEGLIAAGEEFAAELKAREQAAIETLYAKGGDPVRLAFYQEFIARSGALPIFGYNLHPAPPPTQAEQAGLDRVLRLASQGVDQLRAQRRVALVARHLHQHPADVQHVTGGYRQLLAQGEPILWATVLRQAGIDPGTVSDDQGDQDGFENTLFDEAALAGLTEAAEHSAGELDQRLSGLDERIAQLDGAIASLTEQMLALSNEVSGAATELQADMRELIEEDPAQSMLERRAHLTFVQETLFDDLPLDERIRAIEQGEGAYQYVTENNRTKMTNKLKRHDRRQKKLKKVHEGSTDALEAGRDVTNLLTAAGLVSVEDANKAHKAMDVAAAGLQVAAGLATGNPFSVISGVSNLLMIAFGLEPPPSPEQVRHEQVMEAIAQLARGQQAILDNLTVLSKQVQAVHMELHQVHQIVRSTHAIVVDENLAGLRDCREFLANLAFYAVELVDPQTGEVRSRPDLGVMNYQQFLAHFEKQQEKELYTSCNRFLNDQVRADVLNILKVAESDDEAAGIRASIARNLGKKPDWVQGQLLKDQQRIQDVFNVLQRVVEPKYHARILGSMIHPARTYEELQAKLERILDDEAAAPWEEAYEELELGDALREYYNPLMIEEIVRSTQELQGYRLIQVPGTDEMPAFEQLSAPGYDPATAFGGSRRARYGQLTKPLVDAEKLLLKAIAQNTLIAGDILIPILGHFAVAGSSHSHTVVKAAEQLFRNNAALRENAVRYVVYGRMAEDRDRYFELREMTQTLLLKHVRRSRFDDRYLTGEGETRNGDHARARYAEITAGEAPRYRDPLPLWRVNVSTGKRVQIRKGWPEYYEYQRLYRGLDLQGDLPRDLNQVRKVTRSLDERMSSPFVVYHRWLFRGAPDGLYTRLPRIEEVGAGKFITVDLLPGLEGRHAKLRRQLVEYTIAFSPDEPDEEGAGRLHRELLMREMYRVLTGP